MSISYSIWWAMPDSEASRLGAAHGLEKGEHLLDGAFEAVTHAPWPLDSYLPWLQSINHA